MSQVPHALVPAERTVVPTPAGMLVARVLQLADELAAATSTPPSPAAIAARLRATVQDIW